MTAATIRIATLLLAALALAVAQAQQPVQPTIEQMRELRAALAAFEDVDAAIAAGYEQASPCMESAQGSQGIHFANPEQMGTAELDWLRPELIMYEPREDGSLQLIGIEYLVFVDDWHAAGNEAVPTLLGREFGINTTLLDEPFYLLHVWFWRYNPLGIFANWNPLVSCAFDTSAHAH